jgi:alpha-ketoglutarate-dependent taurine dioxygenase
MSSPDVKKPSVARLKVAPRRQTVSLSAQDLVKTDLLRSGQTLPLVVTPAVDGLDLIAWTNHHRHRIEGWLAEHGGVLFRGFGLTSSQDLEKLVVAASGELLRYTYRSTPRRQIHGEVYTSTEYPNNQSIPLHNEMSYTRDWPLKIWFLAVEVATQGGETPIADSGRVYQRIDPGVRREFTEKGVLYVRCYGQGLDLSWREVFQTADPLEVEAYCRRSGIELEWQDGDRLRTHQVCQGVATHPTTGETVWFNQAHLFHVSSLPPEVREALCSQFGEANLPRNAFFGDGSAIPVSVLDEIREAYDRESLCFPWQPGDVLMLDNMKVAHGRAPFSGRRKVLVAMAEPHSPAAASAENEG